MCSTSVFPSLPYKIRMSETPYDSATGGAVKTSALGVSIWGVTLVVVVLFPVAVLLVLRYCGFSPRRTPTVIVRGNPPREEPKLFDVYVKPSLGVEGEELEGILVSLARLPSTRWIRNRRRSADSRPHNGHEGGRETRCGSCHRQTRSAPRRGSVQNLSGHRPDCNAYLSSPQRGPLG